jgi:hypothetical protein
MGYAHIENLYKNQEILLFRECYALEKIHGTSAHVSFRTGEAHFFAGGSSHEQFVKSFDLAALKAGFEALGLADVVVFGESYGGKCQGMKDTYGKELRFVAFDVKVGEVWLSVPQAEDVAHKLSLEFVHYVRIPAELEAINAERDADSVQAVRNGVGPGKMREGVVLRPLIEVRKNNEERIVSKHKRDEFKETATPREVDPEKQKLWEGAEQIAFEWVTVERLRHVLDRLPPEANVKETGQVVVAMIEDVNREGAGEFAPSKDVDRAIGKRAAKLFHDYLKGKLA